MSYPITKSYALSTNQGDNRQAIRRFVILHDTGNDNNKGANSAKNEASYMKGHWQAAYTHFIVDDKGIYQVGEPGYVAWGALDANPYAPVQIELAHVDSKARFTESYKRYIWLARTYANKYGIPLTLDAGGTGTAGVKTHLWVTNNFGGDHVDPYGYLKKWGISKTQLAKDLKNGVGGSAAPAKPTYLTAAKQVKAITSVTRYHDKAFKKAEKKFASGTTFDIDKVVKYGKITRLQLANGLYITSNTEFVKKVK